MLKVVKSEKLYPLIPFTYSSKKEAAGAVESEYKRDVFARERKIKNLDSKAISEAYHKAKADGSNPELVKAVEDLLGKQKESSPTPPTGKGEREVKQQIETFGVPKQDVEPVHNVIIQVLDGLKKAGLTAAKTIG